MAGNHLQIGQGIGEASTWNTTPAIKAFTDVIAQQRAQRLANQQALLEQAGKINPNGIRQPDQSDYLSKYNDWKTSAIQANQLPQNSRARMDALFNAQQKFGELNQFIGQSKLEGQHEHQLATSWASNPHLFADNAHGQFLNSMQQPMSNKDYVPSSQYLNFERYIDPEKITNNLDKANEVLLKQQEWTNPIQTQTTDKQGNKTGVVTHNERTVDPETLLSTHMHIATASDDVKKYLDHQYPDLQGNLHQQVLQNLIDRGNLTMDKNGQLVSNVAEKTKPEFKQDRPPDMFYTHKAWEWANNPNSAGTPAVPQPQNIPFAQTGVVHAPNYVGLSLPNKNFAGATGVNMETGKKETSLASSDNYNIVGVGDFPVSKVTGQLAQPNWAQQHPNDVEYKRMVHVQQKDPITEATTSHLVPYDNLPKNVANQKDVRTALAGFNKTPVYGGHNQMIQVRVNGKVGQIPLKNYESFKKEYPNAERIGQ